MSGWIKVYRSLFDHWLSNYDGYIEGWLCILSNVNRAARTAKIGNNFIELKPGMAAFSMASWRAKMPGKSWTAQRLRTFFAALERDGMLTIKTTSVTTIITVVNWDGYQVSQQGDQQGVQQTNNKPATSEQQASNKRATTIQEVIRERGDGESLKSTDDSSESHVCEFSEIIWPMWGKVGSRKTALAKWNRLSVKDRTLAKDNMQRWIDATHTDGTFPSRPHLTTWLNQERWNDDPDAGHNGSKTPAANVYDVGSAESLAKANAAAEAWIPIERPIDD